MLYLKKAISLLWYIFKGAYAPFFFRAKYTLPIMKGVTQMKITDIIISSIIKKGILYEARNVDTIIDIPFTIDSQEKNIRVNIKCEHMTLKVEKD